MEASEGSGSGAAEAHYVLHVFPFSLYSIMARFTAALGAAYQAPPGKRPPRIELRLVDLHRDEELTEPYLTGVNPKGQVPAMTSPALPATITDSLDISYYLAKKHFPGMLPDANRGEIEALLAKLHAIQGMSLSVAKVPEGCEIEFPSPGLNALLSRDDISESYRKALEFKKEYYKSTLGPALRPESIAKAKKQAEELFEDISALRAKTTEQSLWIFGDAVGPTVLDAHVAPLIARLIDAGKEDLVPGELLEYGKRLTALPAWAEVTHGRSTIWNISYGHARLLKDI
ncbi:hypothetical protein NKR23_g3388 [Pleurostoma richardsiae]|uniref:GST N-terminal domain-containing protein n=1 Tax=Pleurostoma richardsiae TaxID=41990 RepID=A0AA38VTR1_9PEZI|nr:hypothetical protein NKR23_g3388 [Pleurostoma richardsiae]